MTVECYPQLCLLLSCMNVAIFCTTVYGSSTNTAFHQYERFVSGLLWKLSEGKEALAALAGPVGGLLGALICSRIGIAMESQFWTCCAGVGLLFSIFNLLPTLPLDGGRILFYLIVRRYGVARTVRILNGLGIAVSISLLFTGFVLLFYGYGMAVLFAGMWILLLGVDPSCKIQKTGIR